MEGQSFLYTRSTVEQCWLAKQFRGGARQALVGGGPIRAPDGFVSGFVVIRNFGAGFATFFVTCAFVNFILDLWYQVGNGPLVSAAESRLASGLGAGYIRNSAEEPGTAFA